jgi:hypothetical protein
MGGAIAPLATPPWLRHWAPHMKPQTMQRHTLHTPCARLWSTSNNICSRVKRYFGCCCRIIYLRLLRVWRTVVFRSIAYRCSKLWRVIFHVYSLANQFDDWTNKNYWASSKRQLIFFFYDQGCIGRCVYVSIPISRFSIFIVYPM